MNLRKLIAVALSTAIVAVTGASSASAFAQPSPPTLSTVGDLGLEHVAGELVVGFASSTSSAQMHAAFETADVTVADGLRLPFTRLVRLAPGESTETAMDTLRRQPGVRFVEPNYIQRADATPNDPQFPNLWGLHNTGQFVGFGNGTVDADIDAPEAWDLTTGSTSITVAVVDTGIDYNHPDFVGNLWSNPGETGGGRESNQIDDDGNGFVDDWRGWDFVNNDNDPRDHDMNVGHGTHVAGTIGARGNNGTAVPGINWRVGLVGIRVFDASGSATAAAIANAFDYVGNLGIKVVNYSGGGAAPSAAVQAAIDAHPNTLYVTTAGNSALNLDTVGNDHFPCEYPSGNLICVGASTPNDTLASFSNYGSNVDIAAPGEAIVSLAPATNFVYSEAFDGNPFATRWTKGFTTGTNTWTAEPAYSPLGPAAAPSLTDGSSFTADYPTNSDTWVQPASPIDLNGQIGCSVSFFMYVDVQAGDGFRVWTRPDAALDASNFRQSWTGTGFVDNTIDLNALSGGPLYLRLGLFSDANPPIGFDGVYADDVEVRCVGNTYAGGGNLNLHTLNGTSFAAPHVSGAAALSLSRNPGLNTNQLRSVLLSSGDVKPAFLGNVTNTGRRLNLFGAVSAAAPADTTAPTITITSPVSGATYGLGATVNASYSCDDTGGSGLATCAGTVANGAPVDTSTAGVKTFTVNATDGAGNPATTTRTYLVASPDDPPPPTSLSHFVPLTPIRFLDTRGHATLKAGATTQLVVTGRDGVPPDGVSAVLVNLTVTNTATGGYLTTWPMGEPRPTSSSVNFAAGQTVANLVVAKVGVNGSISIWNSDDSASMRSVDVIVDVVGYFPADAMGAISPDRLLDTRQTAAVAAGAAINVPVLGRSGVPTTGVGAVVVNLTATGPKADGYLTTWPNGEPRPNASSLNFAAGQTVANLVVAKVGADGSISIWNSNDSTAMNAVHVVIDIVGWFAT